MNLVRGKALIFVACGNAAATANLVKYRLEELLKKEKINVETDVMRISEISGRIAVRKPDILIITAGSHSRLGIPEDVPVMSGLPLMTMMGTEDFMDQLKNTLKARGKL